MYYIILILVCMYLHIYIYIYIYMRTYMCVYIYICTYMHIYICIQREREIQRERDNNNNNNNNNDNNNNTVNTTTTNSSSHRHLLETTSETANVQRTETKAGNDNQRMSRELRQKLEKPRTSWKRLLRLLRLLRTETKASVHDPLWVAVVYKIYVSRCCVSRIIPHRIGCHTYRMEPGYDNWYDNSMVGGSPQNGTLRQNIVWHVAT